MLEKKPKGRKEIDGFFEDCYFPPWTIERVMFPGMSEEDKSYIRKEYFPLLEKRFQNAENWLRGIIDGSIKDPNLVAEMEEKCPDFTKWLVSQRNKNFIFKCETIIEFFAYLFPKKYKEEAIGDVSETLHEMRQKGYSRKLIVFITFFKVASLFLCSLRIQWSDLFNAEKRQSK